MCKSYFGFVLGLLALCTSQITCHTLVEKRQAAASTSTPTFFQYCPSATPFVRFATFGDSYASGVTYGSGCISGNCNGRPDRDCDYGNPGLIRKCRRIVDAYAYQLKNDCSWTPNSLPYLDWPACSGSKFAAIPDQSNALFTDQQDAGPANVSNLATLQIGGNDAKFFDVASKCFFQPDANCAHDYGAPYPDSSGECGSAVQDAMDTVTSQEFQDEYTTVFDSILKHPAVQSNANFRLFVLGYAQLFKINDVTNGDDCDEITWTAWCQDRASGNPGNWSRYKRYNVTTELRQAVNNIVLSLNIALASAISNYAMNDPRIIYVNIDGAFQDQRFCQIPNGGSISNGWEDSWFWRGPHLSDFIDVDFGVTATSLWNSTSSLDPATVAACSSLDSADELYAPWDVQLSCQLQALGQPVASQPIDPNSDWSGPGGGGLSDRGEILRTFHPTWGGHNSIYKVLMESINEEQEIHHSSTLHELVCVDCSRELWLGGMVVCFVVLLQYLNLSLLLIATSSLDSGSGITRSLDCKSPDTTVLFSSQGRITVVAVRLGHQL